MEPTLTGIDYAQDGHLQVLHVDDDPDVAALVSKVLGQLNDQLAVSTETSPAVVLERLTDARVDCVVSDYQMPEVNGIELLEAVRREYPNLPFILFTGRGSEEVASKAIAAGVTIYVQKGGTEFYEQLKLYIS